MNFKCRSNLAAEAEGSSLCGALGYIFAKKPERAMKHDTQANANSWLMLLKKRDTTTQLR